MVRYAESNNPRWRTAASNIRKIRNAISLPPYEIFLADRTNGRAYATVLRLSVVVVVCL